MSVVDDITPIIDEIYPLYLQVYHRSNLHFEKLTKDFFCGLGRRLGDKNRFFIWRQNGKIVAFGSCLLQGDMIHAEYLGLDYTVALDLHLYHYTFRDLIGWGIANGYKWFHSSALNYDPKFHLRYRLDPIDLYVRHTSTVFNAVFRRILPWIEPTRYDKTLKKFANYDELWATTGGRKNSGIATAFPAPAQGNRAVASAFAKLHAKISSAAGSISASHKSRWPGFVATFAAVTLSTVALLAADPYFGKPHLIFAYILSILFVAASRSCWRSPLRASPPGQPTGAEMPVPGTRRPSWRFELLLLGGYLALLLALSSLSPQLRLNVHLHFRHGTALHSKSL